MQTDPQSVQPAPQAPAAPSAEPPIDIHALLGEKPPGPQPAAAPQAPADPSQPLVKSPAAPVGEAGPQQKGKGDGGEDPSAKVLDELLGKVTQESAARSENIELKRQLAEAQTLRKDYDELKAQMEKIKASPLDFIKANPDLNWDDVIDYQLGLSQGSGDPQQSKAAVPDELSKSIKEIKQRFDEQQKQEQQRQQQEQQQQVDRYWGEVSSTLASSNQYPLTKAVGTQSDLGQLLQKYAETHQRVPSEAELLDLSERYYERVREQYMAVGNSQQPGLPNSAVADSPTPAPAKGPSAGLDDDADFLRVINSISQA